MLFMIVLSTVIVVGLVAIALAEPRSSLYVPPWSDDIERRLLRERKIDRGWW